MADSCEKRVEFRKYKRMGLVNVHATIERKPKGSPTPRKTMTQIEKEMTSLIDTQIKARNARARPDCGKCDRFVVLIGKQIDRRDVKLVWTEKFRLTDPNGNVVEGVAKYMASGRVNIRTRFWEYICDEAFGNDGSEFSITKFDPEITADVKYSAKDLQEFWKYMDDKDKALWKYSPIDPINPVETKKKKAKKKKKSKNGHEPMK